MPCYGPLKGWRSKTLNHTGKRSIVFRKNEGFVDRPVTIPCGRCDGCMIDRARQWATRCVNEAQMHEQSCFITLTYRPEDLPSDGSIRKYEVQDFMKRYRKHVEPVRLRYFGCGEYGTRMGRPHYHLAIFGHDFPDKTYYRTTEVGDELYTSPTLESIWGKGFCTIGTLTARSAGYIARYIGKQFDGIRDKERYIRTSYDEGVEDYEIEKEFGLMSRGNAAMKGQRPGIGGTWFDKYKNDCRKDFLVVEGIKVPLPRYYRDLLEEYDKEVAKKNKRERKRQRDRLEEKGEYDSRRLDQKEKVKKAQLKMLRRGAENA